MAQTLAGPRGWHAGKVLHRLSSSAPQSYDAESHSCQCVISTGAPVDRFYGREVLQISQDAIDLSRVPCPVLDSHSQASVADVLGRIDSAWIRNGQLFGKIIFAQTPRGRLAEGMVARGELSGTSAGYKVLAWSVTDADGDLVDENRAGWDDDLTFTATKWQLLETSLVGIAADGLAGIRALGGDHHDEVNDIRTRMECRQRMHARQQMHDAAQALMLGKLL
jgi:phage head maturation protease